MSCNRRTDNYLCMKKEIIFLLILVAITLSACKDKDKHDEDGIYDNITTTTYNNIYNENGKLLAIKAMELKQIDMDGQYIISNIDSIYYEYNYSDNNICKILEKSIQYPDNIYINIIAPDSKEDICISNNTDTTFYSKSVYLNQDNNKPVYNRLYSKRSGIMNDGHSEENTETYSYYNDEGNVIKTIEHDLKSGNTKETSFFYNMTYAEAQKLASTDMIACINEIIAGDTIITQYIQNGNTAYNTKKYHDSNKEIEEKFDFNYNLIERNTKYQENIYDVEVNEITEFSLIDTIYYLNGKEMQRIMHGEDLKTISNSEYDEYGNITKNIQKTKFYLSDDELMDEMLEILRNSKN